MHSEVHYVASVAASSHQAAAIPPFAREAAGEPVFCVRPELAINRVALVVHRGRHV